MMVTAAQYWGGLAADLAFGDPRWLPHPVGCIARSALWLETGIRQTRLPLRLAGAIVWLSVVSATAAVVALTLTLGPWVGAYWVFSGLAIRSLDDHARLVVRALQSGNLPEARLAVAQIVGRDTHALTEPEVTRALVESVAESLCDGVLAPLFWLLLAGPAGLAAYKAVNTLDSLFGHRNERYREFGWCAARMDDLWNWAPARLTAALIWLVAALTPGLSARDSWRAVGQDAARQPSPNSGYPEAAVAGALGVQLGGLNYYGGVPHHKATLGVPRRDLTWQVYGPLRWMLYAVPLLGSALVWLGASLWR